MESKNFEEGQNKTEEKKTYPIKRVCMICHKDLGEIEGGTSEGQVSHGICQECLPEYKRQMEEEINNLK